MLRRRKGRGENICKLNIGGNVIQLEKALKYLFSCEMTINFYTFSTLVKNWVLGNLKSLLVVIMISNRF